MSRCPRTRWPTTGEVGSVKSVFRSRDPARVECPRSSTTTLPMRASRTKPRSLLRAAAAPTQASMFGTGAGQVGPKLVAGHGGLLGQHVPLRVRPAGACFGATFPACRASVVASGSSCAAAGQREIVACRGKLVQRAAAGLIASGSWRVSRTWNWASCPWLRRRCRWSFGP